MSRNREPSARLAFEPAAESAHGRIPGCTFERVAKGIERAPAALASRVER